MSSPTGNGVGEAGPGDRHALGVADIVAAADERHPRARRQVGDVVLERTDADLRSPGRSWSTATCLPARPAAERIVSIVSACSRRDPCEKLSRATSRAGVDHPHERLRVA